MHQAGLSIIKVAGIAIDSCNFCRVLTCMGERMILDSAFAFKSWAAYISGLKVRALVMETVLFLLFPYRCSSPLWKYPTVADCKFSEKQRKKTCLEEKKYLKERKNY